MSWKTVKLGEVLTHRKGFITISDSESYKLCRVQLHRRGVLLREILSGAAIKTKKQQLCKANDFIVAEMDAKVGGYGFIPDELEGAIVSSHYYLFELNENLLKKDFLAILNKTQTLQNQIKATGSTNYASIRPSDVLAWEIPLPPLEEQERIIESIQRVETNKTQISTELNHQISLVKELRQAYLREATQGNLTAQDDRDEPAKILLRKIKGEKEKLIAERKIKRDKPLPPISPEENLFEIPANWAWCRLGEIAEIVRGGSPRPAGDKRYYEGEIPFLKVADLTASDEIYLHSHTYTIKEAGLHKTRMVEADTLMLTNSGATLGIPKICTFQTTFNDGIAALLKLSFMNKKFLYYFLKSKSQWYLETASRGQGQPNLNTDIISNTPLALPPLAEQERIVAKLEKLMKVCDDLQTSINQSKSYADSLLQIALKEALTERPISQAA